MNRHTILILVLFAAGLFYFGYLLPQKSGVQEGEEAPAFALSDVDGTVLTLSDFRGKTVLLNFWATWCPPCIWEMPSLERLSRLLSSDGLVVIAVSVDDEGWAPIRTFQEQVQVSFPLLLDETTDVAALYGTYQLPESYLISPEGIVLKKFMGPREWDDGEMLNKIRRLMMGEQEAL